MVIRQSRWKRTLFPLATAAFPSLHEQGKGPVENNNWTLWREYPEGVWLFLPTFFAELFYCFLPPAHKSELDKKHCRMLVGLLTGHINLQYMLHKVRRTRTPSCRRCAADKETSVHCLANEKWHNSRFFINWVHRSMRMFRVYSNILLREIAMVAVKRTVLPKMIKQNCVFHYFWKKVSKLNVSQNTRKKWRISIKTEFLIYFGGNCGRSDDFLYYLLNPWLVTWYGNPCYMIFGLFSMLLYVKWSLESEFPLMFDHQIKLTELWQFFS